MVSYLYYHNILYICVSYYRRVRLFSKKFIYSGWLKRFFSETFSLGQWGNILYLGGKLVFLALSRGGHHPGKDLI